MDQQLNVSRRTLLAGAGAGLVGAAAPILYSGVAAAAPSYDPQQRFLQFIGGGNGVVHAQQVDGSLLWYRNTAWATCGASWVSGSRRVIGTGWQSFARLLGGTDGSIYGLMANGDLFYYRYAVSDWTSGAGSWTSYGQIGSGWDGFAAVVGFDGNFYGITTSGDIYYYRYDAAARRWAVNAVRVSGNYGTSTMAEAGNVFIVNSDDVLRWYRHDDRGALLPGSGTRVGNGFNSFEQTFALMGQGLFHAIPSDPPGGMRTGPMYAYRLTNYATVGPDGGPRWAYSGPPRQVGSGWTVEATAALQGYPITRSVRQGESAQLAVSSSVKHTMSVVRVGTASAPVTVLGPTAGQVLMQTLPVGFLGSGCGWQATHTIPVGVDWSPGLYAARLTGPNGLVRDIPFLVKPAAATPRRPVAVILPTNTYNAYNNWGGHSNYCGDLSGQVQLSFDRPSRQTNIVSTGVRDHTLYSDVLLLRWFAAQGVDVDVYDDVDVHTDPALIKGYRAVVLGSHPEYWTETGRQSLVDYVAGGGRLICTGGNALYARVRYDEATHSLGFRRPDGVQDTYSDLGLPASLVLGVNFQAASMNTYAPFVVKASPQHPVLGPLLAGTGLVTGSIIGATGYNGPASGWELDGFLGWPGEFTDADVVAVGQNATAPARMVFRQTAAGGFVFSTSSISFNGALADDAAMSKILRNVVNLALAAPTPTPTTAPATKVAPIAPQKEKSVAVAPPN